jgi:hypothetical protein
VLKHWFKTAPSEQFSRRLPEYSDFLQALAPRTPADDPRKLFPPIPAQGSAAPTKMACAFPCCLFAVRPSLPLSV